MKGFRSPVELSAVFLLFWCVTSATLSSIASEENDEFPESLIRRRRSYGPMNEAELMHCLNPSNMGRCMSVRKHATAALEEARRRYPDSLHNGDGDAFRHCYWCARMTKDLGEEQAKGFGDRHEQGIDQPATEKEMDLKNNAIGRSVGKSARSYEAAAEECDRLAKTGGLQVTRGNRVFQSGSVDTPNIRPSPIGGPKIFRAGPQNNPNPQDPNTPVLLRILPDLPKAFPAGVPNRPSPPDNSPKIFRPGFQYQPPIQHSPVSRPNVFPPRGPILPHSPISRPNIFPPRGPVLPHSPVSRPSLFPSRRFNFGG